LFLLFEKLTNLSLNLIEPSEGLSIKDIKLSNVDFPDPEGPLTNTFFLYQNCKTNFLKL